MAREGEHNAQLKVQGDTQSGVKEMRQLAAQMNGFEKSVEQSNRALTKHSAKLKQLDTDVTKSGQGFMEARGRILGFAGAMIGAVMAVDRMAHRARELQPEVKGLANTWVTAVDELKQGGERLITTIDKLPLALKTVREELGLMSDAAEEQNTLVAGLTTVWEEYITNLSPLAGKDWLPIQAVHGLGDAVDDLSANLAKPALTTGMDNLIKAARHLEAMGLVKTMNRQNAEMERSIEMLEANARSAELVQRHLERGRSRGGSRRAEPAVVGEAFEFTPAAREEMQGGPAADRQALREDQDARIQELMDFKQRELEVELEADLQRIAQKEELGILEPIDAINLEQEAQIEHLEAMRGFTADRNELQRITNQQEAIYHAARMKRLELERQAELKRWRTTAEIAAATAQITQGGIATASMAADMFIASEKRREQAMYITGGVSALVTGIEQQVQAIAAFASFNYVQGALHQAAAIFAFAQSGFLFAKAGGAGGRGGGSRGLEAGFGAGGAANGPMGAANGGGTRSEGLQNQIQSDVPPSQAPTASGPTPSSGQQQGGTVVHFNGPFHAYGIPQDEFIDSITRGQQKRSYNTKRVGNG